MTKVEFLGQFLLNSSMMFGTTNRSHLYIPPGRDLYSLFCGPTRSYGEKPAKIVGDYLV